MTISAISGRRGVTLFLAAIELAMDAWLGSEGGTLAKRRQRT